MLSFRFINLFIIYISNVSLEQNSMYRAFGYKIGYVIDNNSKLFHLLIT